MSNFTFTASKINLDGSLSHTENLAFDELDEYMERTYGKFASIRVGRSDGKVVFYTDNGQEWVKV